MTAAGRDDNALAARLKDGDLRALDELMERHKHELFRLALRFLGNRAEAEEAVQDAFLRAYQRIHSFEGRARLSTWLYRLCVNLCLNRQERGMKRKKIFAENESAERAWKAEEHDYSQTERAERVHAALAQLPAVPRLAVSLYYLEGFACGEIAEILDKPVNTVKTILARSRERLKELLAEYEREQEP
jgi:RNA polymerase sigma-70 factor (ECF subfamily)